MAKKRRVKRPWNKGFEMGQKDALTPAQVKRVRHVLARRGVPGLRDLALFSVAIDTMLQGPELLNLTVKDVRNVLMVRFAKLLKSRASEESRRSGAHCPRHQPTHWENGLGCLAKNARIIFSPAVAPTLLVR